MPRHAGAGRGARAVDRGAVPPRPGRAARAIGLAIGLAAGLAPACGARTVPGPPPRDRIAIIASERGAEGARLVAIDEHGDRQFALIQPATGAVRDVNPAVSPDGGWLVFASSRGRPLDQTSLWIAALGVELPPRRLTDGTAIDAHPAWTPDGRAIVFASTRDGGEFDLWRLAVAGGQPGELTRLTRRPGHEVTPAVAPDGTVIYAAVTPRGQRGEVETHLEERAPDGTIRVLTAGPADSSPAVSPDGARLVFARPQIHGNQPDSELWLLVRSTGAIAPLVDLPLTDESGPVWSRDGRFVFATSVLRGEGGRVLFSSVIHVDTGQTPPIARILEDRVGAIVRLTPAVTATPLDAAALHGDPEYLPELARIMANLIEQQRALPPEPAPSGRGAPH
jgi:dipeptidyl aminopeptidase/acylaminoacyl peptidase